ncbi:non-ribosomal peptide synthetase [Streptomyces lichenis]|uniref:Non-ribosomal peptide synthetase n=1 Tax=Streptomyces lichenis TaxID=2306967 RepID=A0ABT0IBT7_9ACTN|nr:non-ribosomal peptide synthetase [Streptomyces lichenis]MCK8678783.1 non-ribosomal peptide synthetase [Streptomyces lichenis]
MQSITGQYLARYRRLDEGGEAPLLLPATGAQRRFLLVRALDRAGRPDLVPMFFAFPAGTVDPERLRAAAARLAARHPALRARPSVVRGIPVLRLAEPEVPVARVARLAGESAEDALRRALAEWAVDGPPMRILLAEDTGGGEPGQAREILAIVLDHAVCDGWSLGRIVAELGAAYEERGAEEADGDGADDRPADYRAAVLAQLDAEERASTPAALDYWGERLRTVREHTAPPVPSATGASSGALRVRLPGVPGGVGFPALLDGCTAAVQALYGAEGGPVPLGYPWGGRPPGAEEVLGCFLNTLVFPAGSDQGAGRDSTTERWWDDLDRADTPFDAVVQAARAAGSAWSGALAGLLTVDDVRDRPALVLGGVPGREAEVDGRPVRGPFAVSVTQGDGLRLRMVWDRAVLADRDAERAFAALTDALRVPEGPEATLVL